MRCYIKSMAKFKDLTGLKFARLKVLSFKKIHNGKRFYTWYDCVCDCGNSVTVRGQQLTAGGTKSCGCLNLENHYIHGQSGCCKKNNGKGTPTYESWTAMKARCYHKRGKDYGHYGARGIVVCDAWKQSFLTFLKDMGERPEGKSLGRINNDGNYEPGNCRWETNLEQQNNRRSNRWIEFKGQRKTAIQWARFLNVGYSRFLRKLNKYGMNDAWIIPCSQNAISATKTGESFLHKKA